MTADTTFPDTVFLILSNVRCGSTWLEMALGEWPEVSVDCEYKINPPFAPHPHLRAITSTDFRLEADLAKIGVSGQNAGRVAGSKLTLDIVRPYTAAEYDILRAVITPRIKIIGLVRDYREIFYSFARLIIRNEFQNVSDRIADLNPGALQKQLVAMRAWEPTERAASLAPDGVRAGLRVIDANVRFVREIASRHPESLLLDYNELAASAPRIAALLELPTDGIDRMSSFRDSAVAKLPEKHPSEYIANHAEVDAVITEMLAGELSAAE